MASAVDKASSAAEAAAAMPRALATSISSWGVAAAVGTAALLGSLAAIGAFAEGGIVAGGIPGKDSVPALLTPGEFVIPADVVAKMGAAHFEAYRRGGMPVDGNLPQPRINVSGLYATGGLVGNQGLNLAPAKEPDIHIAVINTQAQLREFLQSREGRKIVINSVKDGKFELGLG
jgi:hypothetical protein